MDVLVRSMTALTPSTSENLGFGGAAGGPLSPRSGLRLPLSTASGMEGRLALLEAQLLAAEQQREAANTQLLAAMQRADAAATDVARCARLQRQLQELEVGGAPALLCVAAACSACRPLFSLCCNICRCYAKVAHTAIRLRGRCPCYSAHPVTLLLPAAGPPVSDA
jgi:hypothetical protein